MNHEGRIEQKVDKIVERISDIDINIVEIKKDLAYHIKRTDLLEKQVVPVWTVFKSGTFILGTASLLTALAAIVRYITHA